jgi:hypothetical protein
MRRRGAEKSLIEAPGYLSCCWLMRSIEEATSPSMHRSAFNTWKMHHRSEVQRKERMRRLFHCHLLAA